MIDKNNSKTVTFQLGGMIFEYDEWKNEYNLKRHGISFKSASRVFFDYDRIELYDEDNSKEENRFNTIGNIRSFFDDSADILFVVYTERVQTNQNGKNIDVTRLISARQATNFERGLYYGKYQ